jgi:hypothetical protein
MAKRYHESKGMEKSLYEGSSRRFQEPYAGGMEQRRRSELEDAGMIHEDRRAIANLPQEVMIKAYPYTGPYLPEGLDDTIRGVDHQIDDLDNRKRSKNNVPKKY